ncbi:hypothetical protein G9U52_05580 [Paenibacillus sp. S3N08]|uniref:Uncharacterized protein n=2 Tax=Paenibacillus agricola TaxID=2716264 RepID=A0ABX0J0F8_9BACL|nr:hypothetical protein [Paenibacillus agricola]
MNNSDNPTTLEYPLEGDGWRDTLNHEEVQAANNHMVINLDGMDTGFYTGSYNKLFTIISPMEKSSLITCINSLPNAKPLHKKEGKSCKTAGKHVGSLVFRRMQVSKR